MTVNPDPGARREHFDPRRPPEAELRLTAGEDFSLAAVGDCILSRPMSQYRASQPRFAALLDVFAQSTVVHGNLETVAVDHHDFTIAPYAWTGDWPLRCEPAAIADLQAMGFDLLARANNHALDWGIAGMRMTSSLLGQQGLAHAGCGETLALARAARFRETPAGRVGLVSCVTTYRETTDALDQHGAAPGRPGVNALPLTRRLRLPAAIRERLESLRGELRDAEITDALLETELDPAPAPEPHYVYEPDPSHLAAILKEVRHGKQSSDLMLVALHAHEARISPDPAQPDWQPEAPADFVVEFGRQAIDAGADAVVVTGLHHLGPIVTHAGRPILTGLGNFFWSDLQTPLPADLYAYGAARLAEGFEHPQWATDADLTLLLNNPVFAYPESFLSVVAQMSFDAGGLRRLLLHPVDMGYGDPLSLSGLPRLARPEQARRIFARLCEISAAQGTEIALREDPERDTVVGEICR